MTLNSIAEFFLSEWLWSMTLGVYQAPLATLFMVILVKMFNRIGWLSTIALSIASNFLAVMIFALLVIGVVIYGMSYTYSDVQLNSYHGAISFMVPFMLGMIYAALQIPFFMLMRRWYKFSLMRIYFVAIFAHTLAAALVYSLLPIQLK